MRIHILGICGTFMAGIAVLAKQLGHEVSGSDENVYPPMSTQLIDQGIILQSGYDPKHLEPRPDCIIVGNAMKRGNPCIEAMLNQGLVYTSGPQWLAENILQDRWVLAVAGTHGKTTTTSLLAWILEYCDLNPGFLIGGIPQNFPISARLGSAPFFVIEADEYDTAFFDKRSKFIHYKPKTLILNNLEFDHADIFADLAAIKTQFHHLIRTVPSNGLIINSAEDAALADTIKLGCWTPVQTINSHTADWQAKNISHDGSEFEIYYQNKLQGKLSWSLLGQHNIHNALAAIAAAHHAGLAVSQAITALEKFIGIKRRLEIIGEYKGITVYDDFAHHPTAIKTTLAGLRKKVSKNRILAILELGSYTMRTGVHKNTLPEALADADIIYFAKPKGEDWGVAEVAKSLSTPAKVYNDNQAIIQAVLSEAKSGDQIVIMSNTGFGGLHKQLLEKLGI